LSPQVDIQILFSDGDRVSPGECLVQFWGSARKLLLCERVMLNLVGHLSGIATQTRLLVDALDDPKIQVLDTRKTTPLLRFLEREAVKAGGGNNHRLNLSDMVLMKENHLKVLEKRGQLDHLGAKVRHWKLQNRAAIVEVEIETLAQIETLDLDGVDLLLLDNFPVADIPVAKQRCLARGYKCQLEVSGNITLGTIAQYRGLPIDRISCGSLTHSVKVLDISLLFGLE
jgi:nicotinate-nucleotide pyrophosphorylase (carboxylating)